jgi:type III secretory pathway lipoprotein EscJ
VFAIAMLAMLACVPADPPRPASKPDKRELFGDAGLVPTREGERIRRELALADELERLLARASVPASVSVSLVEPASAVVVAQAGERETIQTIARAALPELDDGRIHVTIAELGETPSETDTPRSIPVLMLTLALGLALGIAVERGWQRRR